MKWRRLGCLVFGVTWSIIFFGTLFVSALGHSEPIDCTGISDCEPFPSRWTDYLIWIEFGTLFFVGFLYWRAEKGDDDL